MFATYAPNLVPHGRIGIVVHNVVTGETHLVVKRPAHEVGDSLLTFDVSADGNIVSFIRYVPGRSEVYVKNRRTGNIRLISVKNGGEALNVSCVNPSVSANGRYVGFSTYRYVPVPGEPPMQVYGQVYVRDRVGGHTTMASVSSAGTSGSAGSWGASLAGDGRYVAFASAADNLVPQDTNDSVDAFIHRFR